MDITPLAPKDKLIISHYGDGGFVVNGIPYKGNILITSEKVIPWTAIDVANADAQSFEPLFEKPSPEIVLIGFGARFMPLPQNLRMLFRNKNIACDAMDTGAACRTYTVLLTEGRLVSASLIAI